MFDRTRFPVFSSSRSTFNMGLLSEKIIKKHVCIILLLDNEYMHTVQRVLEYVLDISSFIWFKYYRTTFSTLELLI